MTHTHNICCYNAENNLNILQCLNVGYDIVDGGNFSTLLILNFYFTTIFTHDFIVGVSRTQ